MPKQKPPEQRKKDARRALIIFILATAFFVFSLVNFIRVEW